MRNTENPPAKALTVLKEIEALSKDRPLPIIGPMKGKYLQDTVRGFKVETALEVGTLIGYSAILIALNLPANGQLVTIEINPESARLALENIKKANLSRKIHVYTGDAIEVIPGLDMKFDMVFLDAAKRQCLDYLRLSEKKLIKGGVVFADNVKMFADEMRDYLEYVRASGRYSSEYIDVGSDGVEVSVKLF